jgi:capsular exopolysaccharide synthesis family protein
MSRIYEALQRADLERKAAQESGGELPTAPKISNSVEEPPRLEANFILENIAHHRWSPSVSSFPTLSDRGAGVEQFRRLRSRVYQARYEAPLKTLLISSGVPSEGKSFVVANLAMSLARHSMNNILLIDADLRRPTIHTLLGAPNVPGLSEYLSGSADLHEIMQRDSTPPAPTGSLINSVPNFTLIPAGKCGDNSSELIANRRVEELVKTLSPYFDWILIDSPPVLAVTDAIDLARAADGVLLVVRGASTPFDVAQRAQASFANSRIVGFVLNDVKDAPQAGSYYYYYYGAPEPGSGAKHRKDAQAQG